jgi:hypothetical protein
MRPPKCGCEERMADDLMDDRREYDESVLYMDLSACEHVNNPQDCEDVECWKKWAGWYKSAVR